MPDQTGIQLPPPSDWQAFERLCHTLWKDILGDENTQLNGRGGQNQHGVDVFGYSHGAASPSGIQCKGKDGRFGSQVEETELLEEVEKAKTFRPPLREFILATTANNDARIQQLARRVNEKHIAEGLFTVSVLGWTEIQLRLAERPRVLELHYPEFAPALRTAAESITRIESSQAIGHELDHRRHAEILAGQQEILAAIERGQGSDRGLEVELGAELDQYRDLIRSGRVETALEMLKRLQQRLKPDTDAHIRFRALTNIAAAKLGLGDEQGAAKDFLAAAELEPHSDKAAANKVAGHLLLGETGRALEVARTVVKQFPESELAWSALVRASNAGFGPVEVPLGVPQKILHSEDFSLALAAAHMHRGSNSEAERYFRNALRANPNSIEAAMGMGAALARQAASSDGKLRSSEALEPAAYEKLNEAAQVMLGAWDHVRRSEALVVQTEYSANLSTVLLALGRRAEGEAVVDQVLAARPNLPTLIRQKLRILFESDRIDDARQLLQTVSPKEFPEFEMFTAELANRTGDRRGALEIWEALLDSEDAEIARIARAEYGELILATEGGKRGRQLLRERLGVHASEPLVVLAVANELIRSGDKKGAIESLNALQKNEGVAADARVSLMIADSLMEAGAIDASLRVYRERCPVTTDSASLRRYVAALMHAGRRKESLDLLDRIPPHVSERTTFYMRARAELAYVSGDLTLAKAGFEGVLGKDASHFLSRARLAEIEIKQGNSERAIQLLDGAPISGLDVDQIVALGQLYSSSGDRKRALRALYMATRRFPDNSQPHLVFAVTVLLSPGNSLPHGDKLDIAPGMAFGVRDSLGKERIVVIQDDTELPLASGEVRPDHALAVNALGRQMGDEISLSKNSFGAEIGTVTWVKHKYVYAAQEIMETFESMFPEAGGLQKVSLPAHPTTEADIAPILASVERKAKATAEIEQLYDEKRIPIGMVARLAGSNILDVWRAWTARPNRGVQVCMGSAEEREAALRKLAESTSGPVIDPISLVTLHGLGVLSDVQSGLGRCAVAQATLDEFRSLIRERSLHDRGYLSLGKEGDTFVRVEVTADDVQRSIQQFEEVLAWTQANCEILPSIPARDFQREEEERVAELVGSAHKETLFAASGAGRLILCDDWHLRAVGQELLGVDGVWTQVVLMKLRAEGLLHLQEYSRATRLLIEAGYRFTSIDGEMLYEIVRQEGFQSSLAVSRVFAELNRAFADVVSLTAVVSDFLQGLWLETDVDLKVKRVLTNELLSGVNPGGTPMAKEFLALLAKRTQAGQMPARAFNEVLAWYKGHFILPSDLA
jgi:tetratricopeptide (TPR) repeat protein